MKSHAITGGGGIQLHVQETGNPGGKPILFLHGTSQSRLAWSRQLHSDALAEFRLVAMDLRGHGDSEKPRDAYGDSSVWAEDVRAVIDGLGLEMPVLCGWSYGGILIGDYVARFGEHDLAGINLVAGIWQLGAPLFESGALGDDFVANVPGLFAEDVEEGMAALQEFVRQLFHADPAVEDYYFFLGFNALVPPRVRSGLFARELDHTEVFRGMRTPMLLSYGETDGILLPGAGRELAGLCAHATLSTYPNASHALFWEYPERFNRELREFRLSV